MSLFLLRSKAHNKLEVGSQVICYNVEVKQGAFGNNPNKLAPIFKYLHCLLPLLPLPPQTILSLFNGFFKE